MEARLTRGLGVKFRMSISRVKTPKLCILVHMVL